MFAHAGRSSWGSRSLLALALTTVIFGASVSVAAAATAAWSSRIPARGSTSFASQPTVRVHVATPYSMSTSSGSYYIKVDGRYLKNPTLVFDRYPSGSRNYKSATLSARVQWNLKEGVHIVEASVLARTRYKDFWSFNTGLPPGILNVQPAPGSTVRTTKPAIKASITDAGAISAVTVMVDGSRVPSSFVRSSIFSGGDVSAVPPTPLGDFTDHTVLIMATDSTGLTSQSEWTFSVETVPRLPVQTTDCRTCHNTYPNAHPVDECALCHGPGSPVGGGYESPLDSHAAGAKCSKCHGDLSICTTCHGQSYTTVPALHDFDEDPYHLSVTVSCSPCHVRMLSATHNVVGFTCLTCHGSSRTDVVAAISAGDTSCSACHSASPGHVSEHGSALDAACTECHAANLVTAHITDGGSTCATCHDSTDTLVTAAITAGNKTCAACHGAKASDHKPLHDSILDTTCAECHEANLVDAHPSLACAECHESSDAGVAAAIAAGDKTCAACHGAKASDHKPLHDSTLGQACAECHKPNLVDEHSALECAGCHDSADSVVTAAVAAGKTACAECHGADAGDHSAFHESTVGSDTVSGTYPSGVTYGPIGCCICHLAEISAEHARATASSSAAACNACHPSPRDSLTPSWGKGCVQGGCHPAGSATEQHGQMAARHALPGVDAACTGAGCHDQGDVGAIHARASGQCGVCHSATAMPTTLVCIGCHAQAHNDSGPVHTADEPGGMTWANTGAYAACIQCHHLDLRTEHAKASSGSLGCDACHVAGGAVASLTGGWNGRCSACHDSIHPEYEAEHLAWGQDCRDCHGDPEDARDVHRSCGASPEGGWTANEESLGCHTGPDYVPTPRLGAPWSNGYWCRACHPNE